MHPADLSHIAWHFARTRWFLGFRNRHALEDWQRTRIGRFLKRMRSTMGFLADYPECELEQLPVTDKEIVLQRFEDFNVAKITLKQALEVAVASESSRDFQATIKGLTVGLSSGTSGRHGVFLASRRERTMWAGIMLARVLSPSLLSILLLGRNRLKVAFFLRANSNLYTTLSSGRIDFAYYDLFRKSDTHLARLREQQPDVLVAPARVLRWLAEQKLEGQLRIAPERIISIAETLEPDDAEIIGNVFGPVHQLYQCTEGFLGYTCEKGSIHLNEEFVHVEPEWLDESKTRFVPIVTDFTRSTQAILRYRLNDVLRVRETPCPCGAVTRALHSIEGRCDDVLWMENLVSRQLEPIFPDQVRHAVLLANPSPKDYRIEQHGHCLKLAFEGDDPSLAHGMSRAMEELCRRSNVRIPLLSFHALKGVPTHEKRRRIACISRPAA